jgi:transposase
MTRRKFSVQFKTKVVLECLKERHSLAELAQKYELHLNQISSWKREFLDRAEQVFLKGKRSVKSETEQEKDRLLKTIGQLKIENDFLKDALR